MKKLSKDEIRSKISGMYRGQGYFDFIDCKVFFNDDGFFKVYYYGKLKLESESLKEAVDCIYDLTECYFESCED